MQNGMFRAECMTDGWWRDYIDEGDANYQAYWHNRNVHGTGPGRKKRDNGT
jgi:hypothetical protein